MKAIETSGVINEQGVLTLEKPINIGKKNVKVIILIPEEDGFEDSEIPEKEWMRFLAGNTVFADWNDPEEDVYTLNDGKPFIDEV